MAFAYLSQRDPRWKDVKLGASNLTMEKFGCTTTALCMALRSFGYDIWPDAIAKRKENYTKDGLILWNNLLLPGNFKFKMRIGSPSNFVRNDKEIIKSIKDPNGFVLLSVGNNTHWVLAMSKLLLRDNYKVADPWKGKQEICIPEFKNITGSSHFSR